MTLDKIVCSKDEYHLELFRQGIRAAETRDKYERTLRMITCKMLEGVLDGDFDERMDDVVELAPQVQFLREIRDSTLLSTASGASFMTGFNQAYYSFSPAIADLERENPAFRDMVRAAITPAMYTMNIMTLADPGSEVSALVFGMLSIGAIAGIYVAGPYLTVRTVSRKVRQSSSN